MSATVSRYASERGRTVAHLTAVTCDGCGAQIAHGLHVRLAWRTLKVPPAWRLPGGRPMHRHKDGERYLCHDCARREGHDGYSFACARCSRRFFCERANRRYCTAACRAAADATNQKAWRRRVHPPVANRCPCGRAPAGSRADAVYCSNACRQRAYRQRGGAA